MHNVPLTETYVESNGAADSWGYLVDFTDLNNNTFWDNDSVFLLYLLPH